MRKILFSIFTTAIVFVGLGCESSRTADNQQINATAETTATDTPTTSQTETADGTMEDQVTQEASADTAFVAKASRANMAEVKLGMLAEQKAMDLDVKKFARQMIQDHRNTNSVLMNIARTKQWLTPENMNATQLATYNRLDALERIKFDKEYMAVMIKDHEEMIAAFEHAANTVTDQQLKEYIANTTPALRKHLEDARSLHARLK